MARLAEPLEAEMRCHHCQTAHKKSFTVTLRSCGTVGIMGIYLKWWHLPVQRPVLFMSVIS